MSATITSLVELVLNDGDSEEIAGQACELFIRTDGKCNWANIERFEGALPGAKIVPVEWDSFGWLIGGIKFNGKTHTYG